MNKNESALYALIYNRVSSQQQETDGSGLNSQEHRCIVYSENKGYIVEKENIFHDTFSGGGDFMRRPAMRQLLAHIDKNPQRKYVVVFDDLKRFARDTKFHIELRSAFNVRKVKVECLNFNFEETPEGNFVETILAAQNQLEREQNQRQVIQKQRSRMEAGYWAFHSPLGYTMQKVAGFSGKVAVPNAIAPVLKEALEGYASFRFMYLADVVRFLRLHGLFPGRYHDDRYVSTVSSILKNPFYAGYIEYPKWEIEKTKGVHKPLIREDIYHKNLARLTKPALVKKLRCDENPEFEFRGLVACIHCSRPFTGAFSSGRKIRYPYYLCQTPGCLMYKKSAPRKNVHDDFKTIMNQLEPEPEVMEEFAALFEEAWNEAAAAYHKSSDAENIAGLEAQVEKYIEMAFAATNAVVRNRYEQKIEFIEAQIKGIKEKQPVIIDLSVPYRTALDRVTEIVKNPYKIWDSSTLPEKKKLFYFFFDTKIVYDIKTRYRTVNPSVLYRFFDDLAGNNDDVDKASFLSNHFTELYQFIMNWANALETMKWVKNPNNAI